MLARNLARVRRQAVKAEDGGQTHRPRIDGLRSGMTGRRRRTDACHRDAEDAGLGRTACRRRQGSRSLGAPVDALLTSR